ncbi:DUF3007 family protein [Synechococcus sp. M16CYN]|uniref:DUF3007 family protein n=1 Tax=Synechococcus sp. M16CYN TaxID=3103139 RepID=UPI0030E01827
MTRGKVLLIGLAVFLIGGLGQISFQMAGFQGFSSGIAAQALLVLIVMVWTTSYMLRVITGRMTYMEQRRRYRSVYDEVAANDIEARFTALTEKEQQALLNQLGADGGEVPTTDRRSPES